MRTTSAADARILSMPASVRIEVREELVRVEDLLVRDAVRVATPRTGPCRVVVIEPGLLVQVGIAFVAVPVDVGESRGHALLSVLGRRRRRLDAVIRKEVVGDRGIASVSDDGAQLILGFLGFLGRRLALRLLCTEVVESAASRLESDDAAQGAQAGALKEEPRCGIRYSVRDCPEFG